MIAPGSKGWIAKFLQLIETNSLDLSTEKSDVEAYLFAKTGLFFGFPTRFIYIEDVNKDSWTADEHLKVLLFESLLFTYRKQNPAFDSKDFTEKLAAFYKAFKVHSLSSYLGYLLKDKTTDKLERILDKRVDVPKSILNSKSWFGHFNNTFIYLDVLLFEEFLKNETTPDYQELASISLGLIARSAHSDGVIDSNEKSLFDQFLLSADLDAKEKDVLRDEFKSGRWKSDFEAYSFTNLSFKKYLLHLSTLVICMSQKGVSVERRFLQQVLIWLNLEEKELEKALYITQEFILENNTKLNYLKDNSTVEKMADHVSKRWVKILGRNKEKLVVELKQSKELMALIRKSTSSELNAEEKEKVKTQFMDILKSMPALAIFLLPGGAILLPIILKIIPTLVPSAFRDNELDVENNTDQNIDTTPNENE